MVDMTDWTIKEKQELGRLTLEAEQLESKAVQLNALADGQERLAALKEKVTAVQRR